MAPAQCGPGDSVPNDNFVHYETTPGEKAIAEEEPLMEFFKYGHLREPLRSVSSAFCGLAQDIVLNLAPNDERTHALRKLLEAKDCAVRAKLLSLPH